MMIRSLASTGSTTRRLVFMLGIAVALIVGLIAMHAPVAGGMHIESSPSVAGAVGQDRVMAGAVGHDPVAGVALEDTAIGAAHCVGDCGVPGNMPDQSMLTMACVVALLAAVIVVLAPALLVRVSMSSGVGGLAADAPGALPGPRPPSLLVLSISRT